MIRSMTAFARSDKTDQSIDMKGIDVKGIDVAGTISWEIRSVNHRYLDVSLYLPDGFQALENKFKATIADKLTRGKLDAKLHYQLADKDNDTILLNESRVNALLFAHKQLENLSKKDLALSAMDILQWQGVVEQAPLVLDALHKPAEDCLNRVLDDLLESRENEGKRLLVFILQRCDGVKTIVKSVRARRKQVVGALRDKIIKRIDDLKLDEVDIINNSRLEQELVFHAQRLDVDEELDRLDAHIAEVEDVLKRDEAVGRRLDFLMQELNREANTLGSKSNDAETTKSAVDLKVLIEQMREQVMNIE